MINTEFRSLTFVHQFCSRSKDLVIVRVFISTDLDEKERKQIIRNIQGKTVVTPSPANGDVNLGHLVNREAIS